MTKKPPPPPPPMPRSFTIGGWRDEDEFRLRRTLFGTRLEQKRVFSDGTVQWRRPMMFRCIYFNGVDK